MLSVPCVFKYIVRSYGRPWTWPTYILTNLQNINQKLAYIANNSEYIFKVGKLSFTFLQFIWIRVGQVHVYVHVAHLLHFANFEN